MKKHRHLYWTHIPILKGAFVVIATNDYKWVEKKFDAFGLVDKNLYAVTLHGEYKGLDAYIIILNFWGCSYIYHSLITHESGHAVNCLFKNRDWIKLKNDEPECYVKEWFSNKTYQALKEFKLIDKVKNNDKHQ